MEKHLLRNIRLFYLFQLLREPLFWGAILLTYIQKVSGMSLSEYTAMEGICILVSLFLQVPMGALADLLSRRKIMLIGHGIFAIATSLLVTSNNKIDIWLVDIIFYIGMAMVQGADNALLFDTLKLLGRENEFKKILGRTISGRLLLMGICSPSIGYLAEYNMRLPIGLSILPIVISWFIIIFLYEPPNGHGLLRGKEYLNLVKTSFYSVRKHNQIKWIIVFIAITALISKLWFQTYNPYFAEVGLSLRLYGWIFLPMNLVASITSFFADSISRKLGDFWSIILIILLQSVPIVLMGIFAHKELALLIILQNFIRGYFNPFLDGFLNHYLNSKNRATVLSIKLTAVDLSCFVFMYLFSIVSKHCPLTHYLIYLGIFSFIVGVALATTYKKIFKLPR